ncbi:hypothetical protein [Microcoleus sp. OTE_8_concoct_300]|uniref:hypothetical protein n=1 Tax=Microcoleus sp. OTE_8_concoct_300 TaxID=2964710 RepID=UPI00403F71CF
MSQNLCASDPRSQFLTYSWDAPLALRWYRDAVFDGISHTVALQVLTVCRSAHWLHYYQAPVLLPEQVDAIYTVEPKTTDRLIRNFEGQLTSDGLFACPETFLQHSEPVLGLCWIGKPHLNYLLPPRAVLKLACWMPATINTMRALDYVDDIASAYYEPLPECVRMTQHYQAVERRTAAKDRLAMVAEAQERGIYAYAKHFGDIKSGVTWKRLLTHYERGGQFPPTREELNDILLEF